MAFLVLFSVILFFILILKMYISSKSHANFWKKQGIPYYGSTLFTTIKLSIMNEHLFNIDKNLYERMKKLNKSWMGYTEVFQEALVIRDPELLKYVLVKDFDHFTDRRVASTRDRESDPHISYMLFSLEGKDWKALRTKLTPAFTAKKVKRMFHLLEKACQKMIQYMRKETTDYGDSIELCDVTSKYTLDVIAEAAFGLNSNAFDQKKSSEFEKMAKSLSFKGDVITMIKFFIITLLPKVAKLFSISILDRSADSFFTQLIKLSIEARNQNKLEANDFLQILLELRKQNHLSPQEIEELDQEWFIIQGKDGDKRWLGDFSDDLIISQLLMFFMAGYDTTQSSLIFALYSMALNPTAQEKLYEEINGVQELTYESVMEMNYLDKVLCETLRLYPPAFRSERVCTKTFQFPNNGIEIKKGMLVNIPTMWIHRDPEYYQNPESFIPERFDSQEQINRSSYTYLAFGHGPRKCIGMRFAQAEVKLALCHIIQNFEVQPCSKTEIPIKFSCSNSLKPLKEMWLLLKLRN